MVMLQTGNLLNEANSQKILTPQICRKLYVTCNVLICHALSHRPRKMSTDEFGKSWGTLSYERKVKLTTPTVKQPAQFMKIMETGFNFHPVQVIGKGEN